MSVKKELAAPCGLYCGVCGIYIAHRDNNLKLKERLTGVFGVTVDQIQCEGCFSKKRYVKCKVCNIRACTISKGFEGCYQCTDFPCKYFDEFGVPIAKKVAMRAVPAWKKLGTEKWIEAEEKRYHCPYCDNKLFRGTKRCRQCGKEVDVD